MSVKPNIKSIHALKPKSARYDESVAGRAGLVARVWPSGKVVFLHRFKVRNQQFRLTLGDYPAMTLQAALAEYEAQRMMLARKENPAQNAQRAAHTETNDPTVRQLATRYLDEYARPRKRSAYQDERVLTRDVLPRWGKLQARSISKADVKALLTRIRDDKSRGATTHRIVHAIIRKMFSFAVAEEVMDDNPAKGIPMGAPPTPRQRYLNDGELRAFWNALPSLNMFEEAKDALRLQILTGTRIGEAIGAIPSEFDLAAREWHLPPERTKNKLPLILPLSDAALAIVEQRIAEASQVGADDVLFPSGRRGLALLPGGIAHALKRELENVKGEDGKPLTSFTSHDLRRTVETNLARLNVPREIRDRILNHKDSSIGAKHYNQHDFVTEKRAALDAWARKLNEIVNARESAAPPVRRPERHGNSR